MKIFEKMEQVKNNLKLRLKISAVNVLSVTTSVAAIPTKFYVAPFASGGDVTPVPDAVQIDGSVSYTAGWPFNYQRNLASDVQALAIPRPPTNQILLDITTNLQQYQVYGCPNFITTVQNGGVAYPYPKYAYCQYDDGVNGIRFFQSLKTSNTDLPTVTASWRWVDGTATGVTQQSGVAFDGPVVAGDMVYWNSTDGVYARALANGAGAQNVVGIADLTFGRIIQYGETTALFSGLTPGVAYYLSTTLPGKITTVKPGTNAVQVGVAKTATTLIFIPQFLADTPFVPGMIIEWAGNAASIPAGWYPNDGTILSSAAYPLLATTCSTFYGTAPAGQFYVPDKRSRVSIGAGQAPGLSAYTPGQTGGAESTSLVATNNGPHTHPPLSPATSIRGQAGGSVAGGSIGGGESFQPTTGSSGAGTPFSRLNPFISFVSIIKLG